MSGGCMRKLGLGVVLPGLLIFSLSCDNPTESRSNPYEQQPIDWPSLADSPWPMYRHDPQLTNRSSYLGPEEGEIVWSYTKPGVKSAKAFTAFAIGSDSTIYFGSSYEPIENRQTWYLYALSPDGNVKWKFRDNKAGIYLMCGPLVTAEGRIIFGSPEGYVYALNGSGQLSWRYTATGGIYSAVINIDKVGNLFFSDNYGSVYSLDKDGNLRWKIPSNDNFYANDVTAIAISPDGQTIYIANCSFTGTTLYSISTDGNIKWGYNCGYSTACTFNSPMVDSQGNIYFALTNSQRDTSVIGLYSLRSDGTLRWRILGEINSCSEPTIDWDGNIYVIYGSGNIYSLTNNGEIRFKIELSDFVTAPLTCDKNNNLYAISDKLYFISSLGSILTLVNLPSETFANPAIDSQGNLYLGAPYGEANTIVKIR